MSERNLILISKIIFFYSIFYVVLKIITAFRGLWPEANLILSIPYIIFALVGAYIVKYKKYHWAYVIAGVIVISIVRYFEQDWMLAMDEYFN